MTTIFDHLAYVRVSWSNGQKFLAMTTAKISNFPWSNGQNGSILTIDHGNIEGVMVIQSTFLTIE